MLPIFHPQSKASSPPETPVTSSPNQVTTFRHQSTCLISLFTTEVVSPRNTIAGSLAPLNGLCLMPRHILSVFAEPRCVCRACRRCSDPSLRVVGELVQEEGVCAVGGVGGGGEVGDVCAQVGAGRAAGGVAHMGCPAPRTRQARTSGQRCPPGDPGGPRASQRGGRRGLLGSGWLLERSRHGAATQRKNKSPSCQTSLVPGGGS